MLDETQRSGSVERRVVRGGGGQSVDVPVEHAEHGRDQLTLAPGQGARSPQQHLRQIAQRAPRLRAEPQQATDPGSSESSVMCSMDAPFIEWQDFSCAPLKGCSRLWVTRPCVRPVPAA